MKTYEEMTFEDLLKYKDRLIDDGVWDTLDVEEKKEINDELEMKLHDIKDTNK